MLENFIFSLNAVMPLFIMIILGFVLTRAGFLTNDFIAVGNKFVFYVFLPVSLFGSVFHTDTGDFLDIPFIAFAVGASFVAFVVIWVVSAFFIKDKSILGAFANGGFRGNLAFLGIPLLVNITGDAGMARAALLITFVLPLYNICSVLLLATCSESDKKIGIRTIAFTIIKNPLIIGVIVGVVLSLVGLRLPYIASRTVDYTASMATPMALICLGGGIRFHGFDKKFKFALIASFVKVAVLPIIFVSAAYFLGFRDVDLAAFLVLGGVPSAIAGYVMVVQMGGDGYTAGTIVVLSTLLSAVSLTVFIYIMRVLGLL